MRNDYEETLSFRSVGALSEEIVERLKPGPNSNHSADRAGFNHQSNDDAAHGSPKPDYDFSAENAGEDACAAVHRVQRKLVTEIPGFQITHELPLLN